MIKKDLTILEKIYGFKLFANCGTPFKGEQLPFYYKQLNSIEQVGLALNSPTWESFELEGLNTLRFYLNNFPRNKQQIEEATLWNKIVVSYKEELPSLELQAKQFSERTEIDSTIVYSFRWMILLMCMENHFYKINPKIPTLFLNMLPIYEAGHITCGWQGLIERNADGKSIDISKGLLLIY